ncbi:MAG: molybdenum cofactor biosynthesis protein MoaE [Pseudobdellovibrio sp.]
MENIYVAMTSEILNINKAIETYRTDNCGAELMFLGTVRNLNEGRSVKAVNYDGHILLGNKILKQICLEAQSKFGKDLNFWIEHRLGLLNVGDVSLIIYITSPHRDSAYVASRFVLEQIKLSLPVWKEEIYCEGDKEWLQGQTLNKN